MCSWDDGDAWELSRVTHPVARKAHRCGDCGRAIEPGEKYHHATGLYDGHWDTYKACDQCHAAADWLWAICSGWLWDGILADLYDHINEYPRGMSPRSSHLTRLVRLGRRKWRRRDGSLVPVAEVRSIAAAGVAAVPVEMRGAA